MVNLHENDEVKGFIMFASVVITSTAITWNYIRNRCAQDYFSLNPPQLGSRVAVVATNPGSGKSFLASALAELLNVPHISDDALLFRDGLQENGLPNCVPYEERLNMYQMALSGTEWIIDNAHFMDQETALSGDTRITESCVVNSCLPHYQFFRKRVDTIIFIDLPMLQIFCQLFARTFWYVWNKERLHGTDNTLTWSEFSWSSWIFTRFFSSKPLKMRRYYRHLMSDETGAFSRYYKLHLRSRHEVNAFLLHIRMAKT